MLPTPGYTEAVMRDCVYCRIQWGSGSVWGGLAHKKRARSTPPLAATRDELCQKRNSGVTMAMFGIKYYKTFVMFLQYM